MIRRRKIVEKSAVLPVERTFLAKAKKIRLLHANEAAEPDIALPHRRAEIDAAGAFFLDLEVDVNIPLIVDRHSARHRHILFEESHVADALKTLNQIVLVERRTGRQINLASNTIFRREIVADDVDAIHDRWISFVDVPTQVDHGQRIGSVHTFDTGFDARVQIAEVLVMRLQFAQRVIPLGLIEHSFRRVRFAFQQPFHALRQG